MESLKEGFSKASSEIALSVRVRICSASAEDFTQKGMSPQDRFWNVGDSDGLLFCADRINTGLAIWLKPFSWKSGLYVSETAAL